MERVINKLYKGTIVASLLSLGLAVLVAINHVVGF